MITFGLKVLSSRNSPLPPLWNVDWLNDPRDFIDKWNGSSDVIKHGHISNLFPRHRHVFQQLQHCMGHVLEGTVQQTDTEQAYEDVIKKKTHRLLLRLLKRDKGVIFTQGRPSCHGETFYWSCLHGPWWSCGHVQVAYLPSEHPQSQTFSFLSSALPVTAAIFLL